MGLVKPVTAGRPCVKPCCRGEGRLYPRLAAAAAATRQVRICKIEK